MMIVSQRRLYEIAVGVCSMCCVVGAQTFVDVAPEAGVDFAGVSSGVAWGDYDSDGDLDLHITGGFVGKNRLYDNRGGIFAEVASNVGIDDMAPAFGATWGDYDNDGDLDLYVAKGGNGVVVANSLYKNNGDGTFIHEEEQAAVADTGFSTHAAWGDYDRDGLLDLLVINNSPRVELVEVPSKLYKNLGDGRFADVFADMGIEVYGLGGAWGDYDGDLDLDLFIALPDKNILGTEYNAQMSQLLRNDGSSFSDVSEEAGVARSGLALGAAWGDYDNDLDLDLFVNPNNELDGGTGVNRLYRNEGDGTFTNVAAEAGVEDLRLWGFGNTGVWGDYNSDGYLDLYATYVADKPCQLFNNNGDGTFAGVAAEEGIDVHDGWSAAWADYDEDGDLDLFVASLAFEGDAIADGPDRLYRNDGNMNRWLSVKLEGGASNFSAIGTRVVAVDGSRRQMREVDGGSGLYSQGDLAVEFGFGSSSVVDSLLIRWPSGVEQVLTNVATNQRLLVKEGDDTPTAVEEVGETAPETFALEQNYPNPFNSGTMIGFSLAELGEVELSVFNLAGQKVRGLVAGVYGPGQYRVDWDGKDETGHGVASGVYLYRLHSRDRFIETRQMTLIK